MGENTKIEWTDHTANFWWGCFKVSPGCTNCYADTWAKRWGKNIWGPAKTTARDPKKSVWNDVPKWNRAAEASGQRKKVFCMSMGDFFEDHPDVAEIRERAFDLITASTWLDWQILTKRPENIKRMVPQSWVYDCPDNVWLGISAENQEQYDIRVAELLQIPSPVHFISAEPLLGPIDMGLGGKWYGRDDLNEMINWVIVGGESGPNARPMHPDWVRGIRDQCQDSEVAFLFKQWGEWAPDCLCPTSPPHRSTLRPEPGKPGVMFHCGKKSAGRLLDGREWNLFPEYA